MPDNHLGGSSSEPYSEVERNQSTRTHLSTEETDHDALLLTHQPLHTPAGGRQWRAMVLDFSSIVEEAFSREEVLNQIKVKIDEITRNAEVVILTAPALPLAQDVPGRRPRGRRRRIES